MVLCCTSARQAPRRWLSKRAFSLHTRLSRNPKQHGASTTTIRKVAPKDPKDAIRLDPRSAAQKLLFEDVPVNEQGQRLVPKSESSETADETFHPWLTRQPRRSPNSSLPLPPLAWRPQYTGKDAPTSNSGREKLRRRILSTNARRAGRFDKYATLRMNLRKAPFATKLMSNPYALALAMPVRYCTLTGTRLPASCLTGFHLLTDDETKRPILQAAEILSSMQASKMRLTGKFTETAQIMREQTKEETESFVPTGAASYMVGTRGVMDFAASRNMRWERLLNLRMRERLRLQGLRDKDVIWRKDMPEYVEWALQTVVMKKVKGILRNKQVKDKAGIVRTIPGGDDLTRLNQVDDVSCVVRVMPDPDKKSEAQGNGEAGEDSYDHTVGQESQELDAESFWIEAERKMPLPIVDFKPLPPRDEASTLKFPTIPYRRRTVPIYDLPHLMGLANCQEMLKDTVFDGSRYIVLSNHRGTKLAQYWLMKLATYVNMAAGKQA